VVGLYLDLVCTRYQLNGSILSFRTNHPPRGGRLYYDIWLYKFEQSPCRCMDAQSVRRSFPVLDNPGVCQCLYFTVKLILMNTARLGLAWLTMFVSLLVDLLPSVTGASIFNPDCPSYRFTNRFILVFRSIKRSLLIMALPVCFPLLFRFFPLHPQLLSCL